MNSTPIEIPIQRLSLINPNVAGKKKLSIPDRDLSHIKKNLFNTTNDNNLIDVPIKTTIKDTKVVSFAEQDTVKIY